MRIKCEHANVYYHDNPLRVRVECASLVYPACSKLKYYASEIDCRESARSLFPSMRTPLSLRLLCSARTHLSLSLRLLCSVCAHSSLYWRLKGAALSVKTQICCFCNFTCKYSRNYSSVIVFILCVAYLFLSDDGTYKSGFLCSLTSWKGVLDM